jgi:hypothetical protein
MNKKQTNKTKKFNEQLIIKGEYNLLKKFFSNHSAFLYIDFNVFSIHFLFSFD